MGKGGPKFCQPPPVYTFKCNSPKTQPLILNICFPAQSVATSTQRTSVQPVTSVIVGRRKILSLMRGSYHIRVDRRVDDYSGQSVDTSVYCSAILVGRAVCLSVCLSVCPTLMWIDMRTAIQAGVWTPMSTALPSW